MNWIIRALVGAVIAGLGWKLGAEAYEQIKKRVTGEPEPDDKKTVEEGAAAQPRATDAANKPSSRRG